MTNSPMDSLFNGRLTGNKDNHSRQMTKEILFFGETDIRREERTMHPLFVLPSTPSRETVNTFRSIADLSPNLKIP